MAVEPRRYMANVSEQRRHLLRRQATPVAAAPKCTRKWAVEPTEGKARRLKSSRKEEPERKARPPLQRRGGTRNARRGGQPLGRLRAEHEVLVEQAHQPGATKKGPKALGRKRATLRGQRRATPMAQTFAERAPNGLKIDPLLALVVITIGLTPECSLVCARKEIQECGQGPPPPRANAAAIRSARLAHPRAKSHGPIGNGGFHQRSPLSLAYSEHSHASTHWMLKCRSATDL